MKIYNIKGIDFVLNNIVIIEKADEKDCHLVIINGVGVEFQKERDRDNVYYELINKIREI